jgi:hypothetical protein
MQDDEPPFFSFKSSYTHARASDPDTSHEAVPARLAEHAFIMLGAYRNGNPLIDLEAFAIVGERAARQRCSDLRKWKLIERTGHKGVTPCGKSAHLCKITDLGLLYLKQGWKDHD